MLADLFAVAFMAFPVGMIWAYRELYKMTKEED